MICPCCNSEHERFNTHRGRLNAACPACDSFERHRLMWLYLKFRTNIFIDRLNGLRVLHCSPKPILMKSLQAMEYLYYVPINLDYQSVDIDLQMMPFEDEFFDLVLCSHVLEHVEDDEKALNEIFRILKSGGHAILLVPMWGEQTKEHEKDKIGHLRIYGTDFVDKVKRSGFTVTIIDSSDFDVAKYGLLPNDKIYCASKGEP